MSSTQRWWAPQRPTTQPDAVVRTLLDEPGDLATTLLAAHRAGAAACEFVAKGAVPNEHALIRALAEAREQVAPDVVDAVSKSMDGNYAGLLVRDILDDAEQAALTLFRTCVNKGVAPPLAAQRVGAVFGVPARELGKYTALAATPAANPIALTDAADRTLLGYVAKVAKEEDHGEVVTFSKAPAGHAREYADTTEGWEEREHPRDPTTGRFVHAPPRSGPPVLEAQPEQPAPSVGSLAWVRQKLGLGEAAPTRVAEVETPPAPTRAPQRTQRTARTQRTQRTQRTRTAEPTGRTRQLERKLTRKSPTRQLQRDVVRTLDKGRLEKALQRVAEVQRHDATPDLLKTFGPNEPGFYEMLDEVGLVLSSQAMNELIIKMAQQAGHQARPGERIFRIGAILPEASMPERATDSKALLHQLDQESETAWERGMNPQPAEPLAARPEVDFVHPGELGPQATPEEITRLLERRRHEMVTRTVTLGGQEREVVDHDELDHVHVLPEYHAYGEEAEDLGYAIVHFQQSDSHDPHLRAMPTVDEIIVQSPHGRTEGATRHQQVVLDPNQAYKFLPAPGMGSQPYESFWDAEREVIIRRWYVRAIDESELDDIMGGEEMGKALTPAQAMLFERLHPRDAEGRFAETEERTAPVAPAPAPPAPVRAPQRERRVQRTARTQRVQREAPQRQAPEAVPGARALQRTLTRAPLKRELTGLQRGLLAARERRLKQRADHLPDLPVLDDGQDYKLATRDGWEQLTLFVSPTDLAEMHGGGEITLNSLAKRSLLEGKPMRAAQIAPVMAMNTQKDLAGDLSKVLKTVPVSSVLDEQALAETIDRLYDEHPDVDVIEIVRHGRLLQFHGNTHAAPPQSLIQIDPYLDPEKPLYMTYLGEYRARDLTTMSPDGHQEPLVNIDEVIGRDRTGEGAVTNPSLHIYRVTSTRTRLYRAGND